MKDLLRKELGSQKETWELYLSMIDSSDKLEFDKGRGEFKNAEEVPPLTIKDIVGDIFQTYRVNKNGGENICEA